MLTYNPTHSTEQSGFVLTGCASIVLRQGHKDSVIQKIFPQQALCVEAAPGGQLPARDAAIHVLPVPPGVGALEPPDCRSGHLRLHPGHHR